MRKIVYLQKQSRFYRRAIVTKQRNLQSKERNQKLKEVTCKTSEDKQEQIFHWWDKVVIIYIFIYAILFGIAVYYNS